MVCNNLTLRGRIGFNFCTVLWTRLRVSFNAYVRSSVCYPSDLLGIKPGTYDGMALYYRLMTGIGLGDSTVFSRVGCHKGQ
jgi:hypothetical protein